MFGTHAALGFGSSEKFLILQPFSRHRCGGTSGIAHDLASGHGKPREVPSQQFPGRPYLADFSNPNKAMTSSSSAQPIR